MFENLTLGQIAQGIATVGVICAFLFKIFSVFQHVKDNEQEIRELKEDVEKLKVANEKQKEELLLKVEETNSAVNLLCLGLSALIDNELNENTNKDALRDIKKKLDEKKEIV